MRKRRIVDRMQKLADFLDLPQDALSKMPRISVLGDREVVIRGFSKIIEYKTSLLRVLSNVGPIAVSGDDLVLRELERECLSVRGTIRDISIKGA